MVASSLDAKQVTEIVQPNRVNDENYLTAQSSQIFRQNMSFSGNERDKLWINGGSGAFADLSDMSGSDSPNDGRAVIAADFDDDGDVDLFVHNIQRERHGLYRNDIRPAGSADGHFVKVRLHGTRLQYEAIGAIVVARTGASVSAQVLSRGAGFASCQAPELVFGLGSAASTEIDVIWPGARRESFGKIDANSRVTLVEGSGKPQAFDARPRPLPNPMPQGLKIAVGDAVPKLRLVDRSGKETVLDVREFARGKPVYLNLWASWCAPCVAEIPELQREADGAKHRVVAIGLDVPGDRVRSAELFRQRGGLLDNYYLPPEGGTPGFELSALVDLERLPLPTTLVLTPEGRLESIVRGPLPVK